MLQLPDKPSSISNCSSYTSSANNNNYNDNNSNKYSNNNTHPTSYHNTSNNHSYNPDRTSSRHVYSTPSSSPLTPATTSPIHSPSVSPISSPYWSSSYSPSVSHNNNTSSSSTYTATLSPPVSKLSSIQSRLSTSSYSPDLLGDISPRISPGVYTSSYSRGDVSGTQSLPRPHSSSYTRDLSGGSMGGERLSSSKDGHSFINDSTSMRSLASYSRDSPYSIMPPPTSTSSSYYMREAPYTSCYSRDLPGMYSSSYNRNPGSSYASREGGRALPYTGSLSTGTASCPRRTSTYRR